MNWKELKPLIRSGKGQLLLMGGAGAGAVGLAVTVLFLRDIFFERFVREKHPPVAERVQRTLERARAGETLRPEDELMGEERAQLYGALVNGEAEDEGGRLAQHLIRLDGETILERLRRTLVAGNPEQRRRALEVLALVEDPAWRERVLSLGRYARDRARRRGEAEPAAFADKIVKKSGP